MNTYKTVGRPASYQTNFKNWLKTNDLETYNTIYNGFKGRKSTNIKNLEYSKEKEYNKYLKKLKEESDKVLQKAKEE
jgi:hypothetical protein